MSGPPPGQHEASRQSKIASIGHVDLVQQDQAGPAVWIVASRPPWSHWVPVA
jgi:hypothetical protein